MSFFVVVAIFVLAVAAYGFWEPKKQRKISNK